MKFSTGDLDQAVIDRVDESIEFGLPDVEERKKLMKMYYNKYVNPETSVHARKSKAKVEVSKSASVRTTLVSSVVFRM